jgi:hypothetical protein
MTYRRWWLGPGLLAVVLACALTIACGDDDNSGTPTASSTAGASQDAGAAEKLRDLAQKWGQAETKITYDLDSTYGSTALQAQVIVYRKPPNSRIDYTRTDVANYVIVHEDGGYSCAPQGTSGSCALLSSAEAQSAAAFVPFIEPLASGEGTAAIVAGATTMQSAPDQTIAGQETSCIHAGGNLAGIPGDAIWCFSQDGLLLSQSYVGAGQTFTMTATKIEQVEDSDFDPPYVVITLGPTASPPASP